MMSALVRRHLPMLLLLLGFAPAVAVPQPKPARPAEEWSLPDAGALRPSPGANPILRRGHLSARVIALGPAEAEASASAASMPRPATLPTFQGRVEVDGTAYTFTMVGSSPFRRGGKPTVINVPILPVVLRFADGTVLDPTASGSGCAGDASALDLTLQSPLFRDQDYGEGVGRQFVEEIRRMEFWAYTGPGKVNPRYSVRIAPRVLPAVTLSPAAEVGVTQAATCGRIGRVWGPALDTLVRTQVLPRLPKFGVRAGEFPLLLLLDTLTEFPDVTAAGYHSRLAVGGQTYGVALFDAAGATGGFAPDIAVLSHEIADWYDDPYGSNVTPPWAQEGQDLCQDRLEVGGPLSRTLWGPIRMDNGYTYHPQETAFFSWFYQQVPSIGIGGMYSSRGTLASPAEPCP